MLKKRVNIVILSTIILCSVSFYELSILGQLHKIGELAGAGLIFALIILHLVYAGKRGMKQNYSALIVLILLSILTSMITAYVIHDQGFVHTLFAQRALYYYFLYFLLHQLKFDPKDLEKLIVVFAVFYLGLHMLQTAIYPIVITDGNIRVERGTIRIYTSGADYIAVAFLIYLQRFLRSNKMKYLVLIFIVVAVYIMRGGRYALAIQSLTVVMFLIIDRKVRSRFFLFLLGIVGSISIFFIFQDIFGELLNQSRTDMAKGENYIRIKAASYYLTEFNKSPIVYITGNGMHYDPTNFGKIIRNNALKYQFFLSDIGLIGNYISYGLFFILGVFGICFKTLKLKIDSGQTYIKYWFIAIIIGMITSGAFSQSDFIAMLACIMYLVDTSNDMYLKNLILQKEHTETLPKTDRDKQHE